MNEGLASAVLQAVASQRWPNMAWLDSGPHQRSVVGLDPADELRGDDLALLDEVEVERERHPSAVWIGWLSYEAGAQSLGVDPARPTRLPGVCLRRFDAAVEWTGSAVRALGERAASERLLGILGASRGWAAGDWPLRRLAALDPPEVHRARVARALQHIGRGDTYQVNVAQRFDARWRDDDAVHHERVADLYHHLRTRAPGSMGGLLAAGERFIVSNSPETLLHTRGDVLRSLPIKGTRPRGADAASDEAEQQALLFSHKDAAEHIMIVDLVRNDLGRIAQVGSVRADPVQLVTLPTVHHLVSEVSARRRDGVGLREVVEAVYPAGSITGAPKKRTVELIRDIETANREVYCGALVLIEPAGITLSVAIRTGIADGRGLSVHGGGGVVIDSEPELERLETVAKVRAFDPEPAPV